MLASFSQSRPNGLVLIIYFGSIFSFVIKHIYTIIELRDPSSVILSFV